MHMLGMFAGEVESGKYVRHPVVQYRKAVALMLIPKQKAGIMVHPWSFFVARVKNLNICR